MHRFAEPVPSTDEMYEYILSRSKESYRAATQLQLEMAFTAKDARESVLQALELAIGAKLFKVVL